MFAWIRKLIDKIKQERAYRKRLKELNDELSLRDERIASLERIEEKYQKLTGNDKPNCEIARKNNLTRILKITVKTRNLYNIEKLTLFLFFTRVLPPIVESYDFHKLLFSSNKGSNSFTASMP